MSCLNHIQEVRNYTKDELLDMLREKVVCETEQLMHLLSRGYMPDIQFILEEITTEDMLSQARLDENLVPYVLQFYLNNLWEVS